MQKLGSENPQLEIANAAIMQGTQLFSFLTGAFSLVARAFLLLSAFLLRRSPGILGVSGHNLQLAMAFPR